MLYGWFARIMNRPKKKMLLPCHSTGKPILLIINIILQGLSLAVLAITQNVRRAAEGSRLNYLYKVKSYAYFQSIARSKK